MHFKARKFQSAMCKETFRFFDLNQSFSNRKSIQHQEFPVPSYPAAVKTLPSGRTVAHCRNLSSGKSSPSAKLEVSDT